MIHKWMLENKVASAFILGVLVTGLYTVFIFLDNEADAERDAARDADNDERPEAAEVKHARRAGRRNA